jgi:hypothetical protein
MGTFVNDSGVIIASYNNEVIRFEKDGLQIFTDNKNVVLVSIQQNQRIERRYPANEISAPSNSGADDLKRKLFLMLEDYGSGGGGVTDLQGAYDGGNVVNENTFNIIGNPLYVVAIGYEAAKNNTGRDVVAFGQSAAYENEGTDVVAFGFNAGNENKGDIVSLVGRNSGQQNEGTWVNAIGLNAGRKNTANNSNFIGRNAGFNSTLETGNTTSHGVTVFSPESIPSYANQAAADAALTVANGCVAGQIYLWRLTGVTNVISFVIPS